MIVLRNIAFYLVFYLGSIVVTSAALLSIPFGWEVFRRRVSNWSGLQRWCVVNLLGVELKIEGAPLDEPVLYAVKHESFFEAIDAPCVFGEPVIFAKQELLALPLWGSAAKNYGIIPVARSEGAKALRDLMRAAKAAKEEGRPFLIFPEGTRTPHGQEVV